MGGALELGSHVHQLIFRLFQVDIGWSQIFFFLLLDDLHYSRRFLRDIKLGFLRALQKFVHS